MKVILTGGTGFIGQYLLREIRERSGIEVICLTSRTVLPDYLIRGENIVYQSTVNSDVSMYFTNADVFIHLAAAIPSYGSTTENEYLKVSIDNIQMSINLFDICKNVGVRNIVNASSIAVYGNKGTRPYKETQKCEPTSVYGSYKAAIEGYARFFNETYGMHIKSLRISQSFGARKTIKNPFLKICAENAMKGMQIPIFDSGETAQDYVYVKDVVHGIWCAINKPEVSGEFNIGSGRPITANEIAEAHANGFGKGSTLIHIHNGKEKMFYRSLDLAKSKEYLGYEPNYSIQEACKDMAKEFKSLELLPN